MRLLLISFVLLPLSILAQNSTNTYTFERFVAEMLEKDFGILLLRNEVQISSNNNNPGAAGYLPTISLNADQNWSVNNTRQEFFSGQVNQSPNAKNSSTNANVRLNWTFFDGFKMFATDKKLDRLEEVSSQQLHAEIEMKIYQASVLFYTLTQQNKLQQIYEEAIALSKARYEWFDLKLKNGAASNLQLIQARLDLTADSSVWLNNKKTIENLKTDLNRFLTRNVTDELILEGDLPQLPVLSWEELSTKTNSANSQLLIAKSEIAIRDLERKEIQSFFYPQISLYSQFAFGHSQNQIGILNSNRNYGPGVGFTLQWNILNKMSTYTALKNNSVQQENADLRFQNQQSIIQTELRKAYNDYTWALQNKQLEQGNISENELSFGIAQKAFEQGVITALELREIQFSIVAARSRLLQAELILKTAELNIAIQTGELGVGI
jgi:outer membrane protein TolC